MTDEELKQLVAANAHAIQAASQDISQLAATQQAASQDISQLVATQQEAAGERQELRGAILRLTDVQEGIANLLASIDSDRPTILRKLTTIENKIDRFLERDE